jgi:hypothetical protein
VLRRKTDTGPGPLLDRAEWQRIQFPTRWVTDTKWDAMDRAMQETGQYPLPRYVDRALPSDALRTECVSKASARELGSAGIAIEP